MTLTAIGWTWSRVGGSTVLHLVPPDVRRSSRTACYRLPVFDTVLTILQAKDVDDAIARLRGDA